MIAMTLEAAGGPALRGALLQISPPCANSDADTKGRSFLFPLATF